MSTCKEIELNGRKLRCYECGKIESFIWNKWRGLNGTINNNDGYCRVIINYKLYYKHRVIAFAFLDLDIDDPTQEIDHIDRVKTNNDVSNLRIVTRQQNNWNTNAKGYWWYKQHKKWRARICVNSKAIHLGLFATEDEARLAYLTAKEKYHII